MIRLLLDHSYLLQQPRIELLVQQKTRRLVGRVENGYGAVRGYITRQVDNYLLIIFVLKKTMCPEMGLPRTNQQEVLEKLLKLLLLDPVFIIIIFDLNKILVVICHLHLSNLKHLVPPLALL